MSELNGSRLEYLKHLMERRLYVLERESDGGLVPGVMDSMERIELEGRIKELNFWITNIGYRVGYE